MSSRLLICNIIRHRQRQQNVPREREERVVECGCISVASFCGYILWLRHCGSVMCGPTKKQETGPLRSPSMPFGTRLTGRHWLVTSAELEYFWAEARIAMALTQDFVT